MSDLPVGKVSVTIPDFHDTPARYARLMEAIKKDTHGRVDHVQDEITFITSRQEITTVLLDHLKAGRLSERVTHNDTKLNNVMIDAQTDEAVCVIDLDTVMPGLAIYDFGDLIRGATSPVAEDEKDVSKVEMRLPMFEADHLEGDQYFKIHHEGHNLDRCRTQLALVKSIEDQELKMNAFVAKWTRA